MRLLKLEAIVIKRRNFGEADRIITVFSKREGKIQIKAMGVRKITSRRASHVELLNYSVFGLYKSRGLPVLTEVELVDSFEGIKSDLSKTGQAYHICELIDGLCAENQENQAVFELLTETLKNLTKEEDSTKLIRDFEIKLLEYLGFYKSTYPVSKLDTQLFIEQILERKLKTKQILPRFK